jgi:hypothetical protein
MNPRKPRNPGLAAAAGNLAEAVQNVRQAEGKLKAAQWTPDTRLSSLGNAKVPPVKAPGKKSPEKCLARTGQAAAGKAVVKTVAKQSAQGQRGSAP